MAGIKVVCVVHLGVAWTVFYDKQYTTGLIYSCKICKYVKCNVIYITIFKCDDQAYASDSAY